MREHGQAGHGRLPVPGEPWTGEGQGGMGNEKGLVRWKADRAVTEQEGQVPMKAGGVPLLLSRHTPAFT